MKVEVNKIQSPSSSALNYISTFSLPSILVLTLFFFWKSI